MTLVPSSSRGGYTPLVKVGANLWYTNTGATNVSTPGLNRMLFMPVVLPGGLLLNRIAVEVTTPAGGALARLGIYADGGGFPGSLVVDGGTVSAAGAGTAQVTVATTIPSTGLYWFWYVGQTAASEIRVFNSADDGPRDYFTSGLFGTTAPDDNGVRGWLLDGVNGAPPNPCTTPLSFGDACPRIAYRVA